MVTATASDPWRNPAVDIDHRGSADGPRTGAAVAALGRARVLDPGLRAFLDLVDPVDLVGARAGNPPETPGAESSGAVSSAQTGALRGLPIAVKGPRGMRAAQTRLLVAAGAVPIGTTSVPHGPGHQTWGRTDRGPTRNPWAPDRTPGGSSAGSAAAVAAGIVDLATGSDGAGSVRIPAAWCSVYGPASYLRSFVQMLGSPRRGEREAGGSPARPSPLCSGQLRPRRTPARQPPGPTREGGRRRGAPVAPCP